VLRLRSGCRSWHVIDEQGGERCIRLGGRLGSSLRTEHLHPRPVRRRALGLLAAPPAYPDSERGGPEGDLARDSGLSDARLAHAEHEPSVAGDRSIERTHQATELGLAANEQVARVGGHRQAGHVPRALGAFGVDLRHQTPRPAHYSTTRAPSATPLSAGNFRRLTARIRLPRQLRWPRQSGRASHERDTLAVLSAPRRSSWGGLLVGAQRSLDRGQ
jgi:hypothetical protein